MGSKITASHVDARLLRGTGGAGTLFASTWLGILVSTTAHFSGSIIGVVQHEGFLQCAGSQTILCWLGSLRSDDGHDRRDMLRAHMADGCNAMSEESASPLNANARRRERN